MIHREDIHNALNGLLKPELFRDYCPNGLQVEGKDQIAHLVTGVTACQALIDAAVDHEADAILVHHGYFWRDEDSRICGMKAKRIKSLMSADLSLFAYHLPLDCHPRVGNNPGLGRAMGLNNFGPMRADDGTFPVFSATLSTPCPVTDIAVRLTEALGRDVLLEGDRMISSVAWCTGGGQGYIGEAADAGADLFVTGEVSEKTIHVARERGVAFIAAGHHATERFGVQAVGEFLATEMGIRHTFVDIDNPA